jgi:hypothetical protein
VFSSSIATKNDSDPLEGTAAAIEWRIELIEYYQYAMPLQAKWPKLPPALWRILPHRLAGDSELTGRFAL